MTEYIKCDIVWMKGALQMARVVCARRTDTLLSPSFGTQCRHQSIKNICVIPSLHPQQALIFFLYAQFSSQFT